MARFWRSLVAVLAGNAAYFLVFYRHLPPAARHAPGRLDWGLVVDFWMCLFFWGVLEMVRRRRAPKRK